MPTYREAIEIFDTRSTAGQIPNRVTGKLGSLAPSRRAPILSNVNSALRHLIRTMPEYARLNADALLDVDVTSMLPLLPEHARLDASEGATPRGGPGKERSNVALFVSVVLGRDVDRDPRPVRRAEALPGWEALYGVLDQRARRDPKARTGPRQLLRFMSLAAANGVSDPYNVPDDFDAVHAWGATCRYSRKEVHEALGAFRSAADILGDARLPRAYQVVVKGIGIRSIPDYVARLRAAGLDGDPLEWTTVEMIAALAPKLGRAVEIVMAADRTRNHTPSYAKERIECVGWLVASLLRQGIEPRDLTILDFLLVKRSVPVQRSGAAEEVQREREAQLAAMGVTVRGGAAEEHSLLRCCLDETARTSYDLSPLSVRNPVHAEDPIPVYTESLVLNVQQAFLMAREMFGEVLRASAPDMWARATVEYESIMSHIANYNKPRLLRGRKEVDTLRITWPQAICMGLPYLRRKALEARRQVNDRARRIGHLESRESQRLLTNYYELLRDYIVVAVLLDDSLRIRNYAGAVPGRHFLLEPIVANGKWVGLAGVRTAYIGDDEPSVKLKVLTRDGKQVNQRARNLTPGIVDMDLMFDWWVKARPHYLAQAGRIDSPDAFDPNADCFAAFPTGRPSRDQRRDASWGGNISPDMLSQIFGRALHEICRVVLGQTDLPDWNDPQLTDEHRSLFCAHIVRTLVSTYFGGIRNNWGEAQDRTNDREETLRRHYNHLAAWFRERRHVRTPDNPTWFDAVIDRLLEARPDDRWALVWDRFDPQQPAASLSFLNAHPLPAAQIRRSRRRAA